MNMPDAPAPQELQFRLRVDAAHCDRAAQGLRLMAAYQYRSRVRHHAAKAWLKRAQQAIRQVAPALAAVAFIASLASTWAGCVTESRSARHVFLVLAAILVVEALAIWLLPDRMDRINTRIRIRFERIFGNWGAARMRKTRRDAPFDGVYDLRGDLLIYSRVEKGQSTLRWHRRLAKLLPRGVALQTPGLLAIFSKPGVVLPSIIVLTAEDGAMAAAIRALGWTIVDIDPTTGEVLASTPLPATAQAAEALRSQD